MKRILIVLTFLTLATLAMPGCAALPQGINVLAAPVEERPPLRWTWSGWPGDYPWIIARELGLYEKYGLEVEFLDVVDYNTALADLTAGKADFINATIADALKVADRVDVRVVLVADSSEGADAIVAVGGIQTPTDLVGKRLGVDLGGVMGEVFVREMLQRYGIPASSVTLVDVEVESVPAQLGVSIDAGHVWEPFITQAVQDGAVSIFTSGETPGLFPDVILVRDQVLKSRPDDIRKLIKVWDEALKWWNANPEEGNKYVALYLGVPLNEISREGIKFFTVEENRQVFRPGSTTTSIFFTTGIFLDFLLKAGDLTTIPNMNQLLDSSYLE